MINVAALSSNAIWVDSSWLLRIIGSNPNTTTALTASVRWRILRKDGVISENFEQFQITAGALSTKRNYPLTNGYLLDISCTTDRSAGQTGENFFSIALQRGSVAAVANLQSLTSGYATAETPLNWPLSPPRPVNSDNGQETFITTATPGAGIDPTFSLPVQVRAQLIGFRANFTASATVATRLPILSFGDGTLTTFTAYTKTGITAGQPFTLFGTIAPSPANVAPDTGWLEFPRHIPQITPTLSIATTAIQAADQWTNVRAFFRIWNVA